RQALLPQVTLLVDVTVGVSGQDDAHAGNALDITRCQDRDMAKHPAAAVERNLAIHFLEQVEHARRSAYKRHRADVVGCKQQQDLLGLWARQKEIVVEPRPTGVWRRRRAHDVRWIASDADDEAGHLEPVIAERGLAEPSGPRLH